jgi:single-strand DNA-binding protein
MSFQISGKLVKKYDAENKSGKFMTREFVIVTEEQYPQYIKFQLVQDRCGAIDAYAEQEKMTVHFDLRGREWQDKYFTNLQAWKVEKAGESNAKAGEQIMATDSHPDPFAVEQKFDDLPF